MEITLKYSYNKYLSTIVITLYQYQYYNFEITYKDVRNSN